MVKEENKIYVEAAKMALLLAFSIAASRVTNGLFLLVIIGYGIWSAFSGKYGWSIITYLIMPYFIIVSYAILPKNGFIWAVLIRFGQLGVGLFLALCAARRTGSYRLPFLGILPFLIAASISSAGGFAPSVSYMKIVNFLIFLIGVWLGTQNIHKNKEDLLRLRSFFLGMIGLTVLVSILLIPFPHISYATSFRGLMATGAGADIVSEAMADLKIEGGRALFCGMLTHSQMLSPFAALSFAWVLCDMLFAEKRIRIPHLILILALLPVFYLTRSRVALLVSVSSVFIIFVYTLNKIKIKQKVKNSLRGMMIFGIFMGMIGGVFIEATSQGITKWVRKVDNVQNDDRGLTEAFTESRQGLIDMSMWEFRRNPMFGSGFQVSYETEELVKRSKGLILTAPIEKGIIFTMVLGETGIVGIICFIFFILSFYITATMRRLYVTITMFTLLLISNMGEATFFSPGGIGSILWILTVIGGFVIDSYLINQRIEKRRYEEEMAMMPWQNQPF